MYLAPKGRKHIAVGEAHGLKDNSNTYPRRGERKKEFYLGWNIYIFGDSFRV